MNQKLIEARLDEIAFSLTNPRGKDFTKRPDWPEFVDSVRTHGVKQPPLVRPLPKSRTDAPKDALYELIAGERRVTAAQAVKLEKIQVLLEPMDDATAIELQQIENLQREDLTPLEEAQGYADWRDRLLAGKTVKTVDEAVAHICAKVGRKRSAVYQKLALLKLAKPVTAALRAGELDASKAGLLAQIPDPAQQEKCLKTIIGKTGYRGPMSFREAQEWIAEEYRANLNDAAFDQKKVFNGLPKLPNGDTSAPACETCPLRSGNMAATYPDFAKNPNICTSPACFKAKTQAHTDAVLSKAKSEGRQVISAEVWNRASYQFKELKETCYDDPKGRTIGALAKAANIAPRIAVDEDGKTVEVFSPEDVVKIKTANKIRCNSGNAQGNAKARAYQKKKKEMETTAQLATSAILEALVPANGKLNPKLWLWLSDKVANEAGIFRTTFAAKRLGLCRTQTEANDALEGWLTSKERTDLDRQRFIVEILLCASWDSGGWQQCGWEQHFLDLCKLAGGTPEKLANQTARKKADAAVELHNKINHPDTKTTSPKTKVVRPSAAARARIAAAAKARWAKIKRAKS